MSMATTQVIDLIFGRWRSQILYAGTALGIFDHLSSDDTTDAASAAAKVKADPSLLYRLMRGLACIGLLIEEDGRAFRLSEAGGLLRADHPQSLRPMALLEEGPEHYAIWKHVAAMVRDGHQNGFSREFGVGGFEYAQKNPAYRSVFDQAMSSYSAVQTDWALAALVAENFSTVHTLCDVAGGLGHLLSGFLLAYPHLRGVPFELPEVIAETEWLWPSKLGLTYRCRCIAGDMFHEAPAADAYLLKNVLHDWGDGEAVRILANLRQAATGAGRVYVIEHLVPGPDEPHFAKLFDIHMMCWGTGRERTAAEYRELLAAAGWRHTGTHRAPEALQAVLAATAA
jgi:hypothetical protein